jgi:hypothetical protein
MTDDASSGFGWQWKGAGGASWPVGPHRSPLPLSSASVRYKRYHRLTMTKGGARVDLAPHKSSTAPRRKIPSLSPGCALELLRSAQSHSRCALES